MAAVAQLVERQIVALNVAGSIPVGRPIKNPTSPQGVADFLFGASGDSNNLGFDKKSHDAIFWTCEAKLSKARRTTKRDAKSQPRRP